MSLRHVVWSIVVGFLVGLFARAIMPGADHMGFLATSLIGILGSLVGGFIGGLVSRPKEGAAFHPAGFFLSVVGALVILLVLRPLPSPLTTPRRDPCPQLARPPPPRPAPPAPPPRPP